MGKKRDIYRVILPCKRYVRAWLLQRYGLADADWLDLVSLRRDRELGEMFRLYLSKDEERRDRSLSGTAYRHSVSVAISRDEFLRYGWMLPMTQVCRLNRLLERRVKQELYAFVGGLRVTGLPVMECVRRWRLRSGITEWDWDTESIRKDLQRHLRVDMSVMDAFLQKIEENLWARLSDYGTSCNDQQDTQK